MVFQKKNVVNNSEYLFCKNRYYNISIHRKLSLLLIVTATILILLGGIIYFYGSILILDQNLQNQIKFTSVKSNNVTEKFASDYVKLIKVHNFQLHDDDFLYESLRNLNNLNIRNKDYTPAFSVLDTFRSKSSQIWYPHPEYILNVFGHHLHLILHQDNSFIATKTFRVINIFNNHSEEEKISEGLYFDCYYKGYVKGDDQSSVAVSLCHGMTGYIKTNLHGSFLIQPVNNQANNDSYNASTSCGILHKIWRNVRRNNIHALIGIQQSQLPKLHRKKRDNGYKTLTIELLIAVDRTMIQFHKNNLKSYILTLISIVSNLYADASIGVAIQISIANIIVLKNLRTGIYMTDSETLHEFCLQVQKSGYHYDAAIFLTRDQLCGNHCTAIGLASMGTACTRNSCAIVKDNGFQAAFTIAHELGHIFNMPHDDHKSCELFSKPGVEEKLHLMHLQAAQGLEATWSDCLRFHLAEFLEQENVSCLEDTPTKFIRNYTTRLPGEIYSLDEQCKLIHGNKSIRHCNTSSECTSLFCKTTDYDINCVSGNSPWADGTPCKDSEHWCQKGECLPRQGLILPVINGDWGSWGPWSQCSLTCSGGIQKSIRACNNPLPQNGGRYCIGIGKKYRSCNVQNCPPDSLEAREKQCYQMNGRDFDIEGIGPHTKWVPKYGLSSKERCNLYCRSESGTHYFRLSDKVIDGATCSLESFDKCVNGVCRSAGCDNILNSTAKLDKCGICKGLNDTCEDVIGNFKVSDLHKAQAKYKNNYFHVTTIPRGASNIIIKQSNFHDENYIALQDDQGNWLLNGNFLLTGRHYIGFYAGVAYDYSGSQALLERISTTYGRKLKRPLMVEIISYSKSMSRDNDTILMTYSYTKDKTNYNNGLLIQRKQGRNLLGKTKIPNNLNDRGKL